MGIRYWLKRRMSGEAGGDDLPPNASIMDALFGRDNPPAHALGEYRADTYPADVAELLRRRQEVAEELVAIDVASPRARTEAIPHLRELLRIYPHALAYEMLITAYMDAGRWDEAKGVAFAARERRAECLRSDLPELRAEVEFLREWTPEEVDRLREDRAAK